MTNSSELSTIETRYELVVVAEDVFVDAEEGGVPHAGAQEAKRAGHGVVFAGGQFAEPEDLPGDQVHRLVEATVDAVRVALDSVAQQVQSFLGVDADAVCVAVDQVAGVNGGGDPRVQVFQQLKRRAQSSREIRRSDDGWINRFGRVCSFPVIVRLLEVNEG